MKKIPTLFERQYENHKVVGITDNVTPGLEWVLEGEGVATVKIDGSCTAISVRAGLKKSCISSEFSTTASISSSSDSASKPWCSDSSVPSA